MPTPPVAVVTDSTHYLPKGMLDLVVVQEVSLYVNDGDHHEREADMPDFDAYYERLRTAPELPTTSQPSIGDFLAVYEPLVGAGRDVVSIHISGGISGTVESARQAAADAGGQIAVVDSESAAGGHCNGAKPVPRVVVFCHSPQLESARFSTARIAVNRS